MSQSNFTLALKRSLFVSVATLIPFATHSEDEVGKSGSNYVPKVAEASSEGEQAIKRFAVAPGLKTDLFAAEPHLANPVSFCFDEKGRVYVAETFRLGAGAVLHGIRQHVGTGERDGTVIQWRCVMKWLDVEAVAQFE